MEPSILGLSKKQFGTLFILSGIGLLIISFAFIKNYHSDENILENIGQMEFVLKETRMVAVPEPAEAPAPAPAPEPMEFKNQQERAEFMKQLAKKEAERWQVEEEKRRKASEEREERIKAEQDAEKRRIAIPFKYFFVIDILIIFTGIGFLLIPAKRE